jgi:inorganic pyrophosphatase
MENYKDWIGKKVSVVMDRPLGSAHPDFPESIYMVNYGYIPGTHSEADNEEIDAYVLGPDKPLQTFAGTVIAVVVRSGDGEIKLVVTDGTDFSVADIEKAIYFQEKYHQHTMIK